MVVVAVVAVMIEAVVVVSFSAKTGKRIGKIQFPIDLRELGHRKTESLER